MAAKRKTMQQIRLILQKRQQGDSIRSISRDLTISRKTVRKYLRASAAVGICLSDLAQLDDHALAEALFDDVIPANENSHRASMLAWLDCQQAEKQLRKPGVTRKLLWEEYRSEHQDGFGYTQFCHYFNQWLGLGNVTAHFDHAPAAQLLIDFSGKKLGYYDPATGEHISCEVFVGVMPHSGFIFAEATPTQQQPDFVKAIGGAFKYIGGVPQSVLCDNLRTAVKKSDRYEPQFTELIEQLSVHYQTTLMATRPRKPRDKAAVEGAVKIVYQRIFAPLRNQVFTNMEALNEAIGLQLDVLNDRPLTKRCHSRRQLFEANEKPLLKSLPNQWFEVRKTVIAKVQKNYHVILGEDWHQYSVPYQFTGQKVSVTYTTDRVEIFHNLKRIGQHKRNAHRYGYTTLEEHMPANHRHYYQQKGWDENYFKKQASQIGEATQQAIALILTSRAFPEQTFNSCLGVIRLAGKYGNDRLEAACKRVTLTGAANYTMIKNVLEKKLDQLPEQGNLEFTTPNHSNLRGANYYC